MIYTRGDEPGVPGATGTVQSPPWSMMQRLACRVPRGGLQGPTGGPAEGEPCRIELHAD